MLKSKIKQKAKFLLSISSLLILSQQAQGQQVLSQGDYSKIKHKFSSLEAGRAASYSSNDLDFGFQIQNLGTLKVSFTESPQYNRNATFSFKGSEANDTGKVLLLKGNGYLNGNSLPVAGSVYRVNGKEELHINFVDTSDDSSLLGGRAHEIVQLLDGSAAVLKMTI